MLSLKNIMRANAASCLGFGSLFTLLPEPVATFLGGASPAPHVFILMAGIVLIGNGLHLLWASSTPSPSKNLILYFSVGDFAWVIISIGLIFSGLWITSVEGELVTVLVAIMVGLFGVLQVMRCKSKG